MKSNVFIILIFLIQSAFSGKSLPSQFKRCKSTDTDCLKIAIEDALPKLANGLKELGVPPLDPIRKSKLTVAGAGVVQLSQNYTDISFSGLASVTLNSNPRLDLDGGKMILDGFCPSTNFKGLYDMKGKLMIFNVYGNGTFSIKYDKLKTMINIDFKKFVKEGETYLEVTNIVINADPERVIFQFDNLFGGNKLLGDNINKVLNENWKLIYDDVIGSYLLIVANYLKRLSNKLFEQVPLKEIFLDLE